jgi:uncharacterized SAM-binding protein YcdF (DUF218 family)
MKWNQAMLALGTATLLVLAVTIFTPIVNVASRPMLVRTDLQPSDAIVVLGAGLLRDGSLSMESTQRLVYGIRLYRLGLAPLLILSGPAGPGTVPESSVRAKIATELGIPPLAILEIIHVNTTRDEARETTLLLQSRKIQHVLLITESLHMLRSKLVFEAAGLTVSPAPSDDFPEIASTAEQRLLLLRNLLMHSAGFLYYRLAGFI